MDYRQSEAELVDQYSWKTLEDGCQCKIHTNHVQKHLWNFQDWSVKENTEKCSEVEENKTSVGHLKLSPLFIHASVNGLMEHLCLGRFISVTTEIKLQATVKDKGLGCFSVDVFQVMDTWTHIKMLKVANMPRRMKSFSTLKIQDHHLICQDGENNCSYQLGRSFQSKESFVLKKQWIQRR